MKEIKIICDKCKSELKQSDNYLIVTIETHMPNISYTQNSREKHFPDTR